jgi:hypothetical protein
MMPRYVTRASWLADEDGVPTQPVADTVYAADNEPVFTGLLNAAGAKLYRMPEPKPVGFDLRPRLKRNS